MQNLKNRKKRGGYKINLKPELMRGINISEGRISDNNFNELWPLLKTRRWNHTKPYITIPDLIFAVNAVDWIIVKTEEKGIEQKNSDRIK